MIEPLTIPCKWNDRHPPVDSGTMIVPQILCVLVVAAAAQGGYLGGYAAHPIAPVYAAPLPYVKHAEPALDYYVSNVEYIK